MGKTASSNSSAAAAAVLPAAATPMVSLAAMQTVKVGVKVLLLSNWNLEERKQKVDPSERERRQKRTAATRNAKLVSTALQQRSTILNHWEKIAILCSFSSSSSFRVHMWTIRLTTAAKSFSRDMIRTAQPFSYDTINMNFNFFQL